MKRPKALPTAERRFKKTAAPAGTRVSAATDWQKIFSPQQWWAENGGIVARPLGS